MGTDFRRFETVSDPIRVHPRNPWLKQLDPLKMLKNQKFSSAPSRLCVKKGVSRRGVEIFFFSKRCGYGLFKAHGWLVPFSKWVLTTS